MLTALKAKVDGTQMITPSNFVKLSTALEESILPMEMKRELATCLETKAAASIQGATRSRLQTAPQSMTMPYNYLAQSEWKEIQCGCNTLDAIKGPDNPTSQLLPIISMKGCSRDGERR